MVVTEFEDGEGGWETQDGEEGEEVGGLHVGGCAWECGGEPVWGVVSEWEVRGGEGEEEEEDGNTTGKKYLRDRRNLDRTLYFDRGHAVLTCPSKRAANSGEVKKKNQRCHFSLHVRGQQLYKSTADLLPRFLVFCYGSLRSSKTIDFKLEGVRPG